MFSGCSDQQTPKGSDNKVTLPKFSGACSSGGGQPGYRIASDPGSGVIYFASVLDQRNIDATKRSGAVVITEDTYEFDLFEIDGSSRTSTFYRKDAVLIVRNPPEHHRFAGMQQRYDCERLPDNDYETTLQMLREGRATGERESRQTIQDLRNRPNKM